jgi:ABC-2 type transport system permease protein
MSGSLFRIVTDIQYGLVQFYRSRQSLFFTLVFPGLLMIVLGYLLGFQSMQAPDVQITSGSGEAVLLNLQEVITSRAGPIDFLFPGILGMCIMFTAINETLSVLVRYRTSGLSQKLSATPLSTAEWNIAKIITGTLIMLLSVTVAIVVAWFVFGIRPEINIVTVLLVVVGLVMFVGLGMIVSNFVSDVKSVNAVAFSITLPLMLMSGSLFPVERLPVALQFASIFSPLTCLNNGLRSAMITGDMGTAIGNLIVGAFMSVVLFSIGVAILMKNDGQDI